MTDTRTLLQQTFPGLDDEAAHTLARLVTVRRYPPNVVLCHEGAYEETFYLIAEGRVAITKMFVEGEARLLRHAEPGEFFGEMALIHDTPRNATVTTVEASALIEVDKRTFQEALHQNPSMALAVVRTSVERMRANNRQALAELKQQHQEVEAAYTELAEQEQLRSEFLTTLAHELRTPLTTATGYMHLLEGGQIGGSATGMALGKIAEGIDRVVSLVNDLLFLQQMELIQPSLRPVDLQALIEAEVNAIQPEVEKVDGLSIRTLRSDHLPPIPSDPDSLQRSLRAILDNAVKFSPEGGEIQVRIEQNTDEARIAVQDPGVGIPEEFLPRIFKRFERREEHGDYLFGGVGLGLPIARYLIESLGGHIEVQSQLGQGSTFTICLPLTSATTRPQTTMTDP